jgi:nucleotide-binding universal stress UspA family protein
MADFDQRHVLAAPCNFVFNNIYHMSAKNKKTILVGIDYTRSSHNAARYAIEMAEKTGYPVTLFHAFDLPIVNTYSGVFFVSYRELHVSNLLKLNRYTKGLKEHYPTVNITCLSNTDSVKEEISKLAAGGNIFCAVLGLETKSKISKLIYGSTGIDLAGKVNCPVIIVPRSYNRHRLGTIAVAVDNRKTLNAAILRKVKELGKALKCSLKYVHVRTPEEIIPEKMDIKGIKIDQVEASDLATGVAEYTRKNKTDLTVVISHSHSVLYKLFNQTHTVTLALRSKTPVLVIHS